MFIRFCAISVACLTVVLVGCQGNQAPEGIVNDQLIAIDVLLEPDATMVEKAKIVNSQLRVDYPQGYALDASHAAHITLLQRYVRTKDLDAVFAAVDKVIVDQKPLDWQFKATGYEYGVWDGTAHHAADG